MSVHVFVAMPFGVKEGIDFNRVYSDLIKPALEYAGFDVFRADEEIRGGNIRTDMFQELLLADLVLADLSIDNPNVWYELGVRHALRSRGVIQIQSGRTYTPFDIYTDRSLRYHLKNGVPDPDFLEADKSAIAEMAKETLASWRGRKISPVYQNLRYLKEPDWKSLHVEEANEFWEAFEGWEKRIRIAMKKQQPGDIVTLADEAPTRILHLEAYRSAGNALFKLGKFSFALEQIERALEIEPDDNESLRKKGILLGRLGRHEEASVLLEGLIKASPDDAETEALLGRVKKDQWTKAWHTEGKTPEALREDAAYEDALLRQSMEQYREAFMHDHANYFAGINALTLSYLLKHLVGGSDDDADREALEGGVRWAVLSALAKETSESPDYWARVSMGDLEVLKGKSDAIVKAYKNAVSIAEKDWFALDSSRQQLVLLQQLGFRPAEVDAALAVFTRELDRLSPPWSPRTVILFSGHMIDAPDRPTPRFPPSKKDSVTAAIAATLEELNAGPGDLAICSGACGGDLLFDEACLARGSRLELRLPFAEPEFLQRSVSFAGEEWSKKFFEVKAHPNAKVLFMLEELGPSAKNQSPFARNNVWQLYTALSHGPEKLTCICLWDGKGGDGPGGTQHMIQEAKKRSGRIRILDINTL
ncbi:MAG: tetratricopeptide repeat protein [Bacteroidetes bacterium]|nr:tetratricopeptide repeat protein [Bacteroidota bacterium]MCW5897261.1 tetratricopeptide repeat protein [Bacteroidota bacterium]